MFVQLEPGKDRPKWVPDSYLHLDFKTFGIADLVGATKAKCASLGIELKAPTAIDRARELAENVRFEEETRELKQSSPKPFREAQAGLNESLRQAAEAFGNGTGWKVAFGFDREASVIRANGVTVQFLVRDVYLNSCREGYLLMRVFDGALATPEEHQRGMSSFERPTERSKQRIPLTRTKEHGWCWVVNGRTLSSDEVVAQSIEELARGSQRSEEW